MKDRPRTYTLKKCLKVGPIVVKSLCMMGFEKWATAPLTTSLLRWPWLAELEKLRVQALERNRR